MAINLQVEEASVRFSQIDQTNGRQRAIVLTFGEPRCSQIEKATYLRFIFLDHCDI
jgi:hypothetical protein